MNIMALKEVTVEVIAKYIIKFQASSADEARKKAENLELFDVVPDYIDYSIIDIQPIKE